MIDATNDAGSVITLRKHSPDEVMPRNPLQVFMRSSPTFQLRVSQGARARLDAIGIQCTFEQQVETINDPLRRGGI
eukprot:587026-Pyramimonas_sp.AAC.1